MGFKEFYNKLNEAPHIELDLLIDFEAEKTRVLEKLVKLFNSIEKWQHDDIVKQILSSNKMFPMFVKRELDSLKELDVNKYENMLEIIPKELR